MHLKPNWMDDALWDALRSVEKLPRFKGILQAVSESQVHEQWRLFFNDISAVRAWKVMMPGLEDGGAQLSERDSNAWSGYVCGHGTVRYPRTIRVWSFIRK